MTNSLKDVGGLLILPRLQIQNANAISGPLTWGFPSPTAFTGFAHALERQLKDHSGDLEQGFGGVGIVCHHFEPQIYASSYNTVKFNLKRMMLRTRKECDQLVKDGKPPAFVEEGRVHLEISLVIVVKDGFDDFDGNEWAETVHHIAQGMRLAGGSVLPARKGERYEARWQVLPDSLNAQTEVFGKLRRRLLPGFALVQREDLLAERLAEIRAQQPDATALDALLDLSRLNIEPTALNPDKPEEVTWQVRKRPGWLVPLPIGYAGISPLYPPGEVENARDNTTPFRFVESLYSLGQWVSPHRLEHLQQLLWHPDADPENGIYRCINRYSETLSSAAAGGIE
ncbi:MAG: type I-F CRISPR-associated protein Csy2 [Synechococcaceae cyanobacterium SM1_2_3]|nr:type I-F CRISPR-associated protein Csy2 [Synechococcaceae cyanobacterium SM1_2_3]